MELKSGLRRRYADSDVKQKYAAQIASAHPLSACSKCQSTPLRRREKVRHLEMAGIYNTLHVRVQQGNSIGTNGGLANDIN